MSLGLVTIVVPVFNAIDDLTRCLESIQRHSRKDHPVLLIDDASSDERVWPLLQKWQAAQTNFRALHNEVNLGYTVTLNRACGLAGPGDLILLNSDTIVTPHWIEQMSACAYSRPDVATVTAISNAAGAFSVPLKDAINPLPSGWSVDDIAALIEHLSPRIRPQVPTGNGFCMYLTAAAREVIGDFDSKHFPNGYGEENDYCLRASAAGLSNLIDDATYIFHKRSASFGARKAEILKTNLATLNRLHPGYDHVISEWYRNDLLDPFRIEIQRQINSMRATGRVPSRARCSSILHIVSDNSATIPLRGEYLDKIKMDGRSILLHARDDTWTIFEFSNGKLAPIRRYTFSNSGNASDIAEEISSDYCVEKIQVHSQAASEPELITAAKLREIFSSVNPQ